MDKKQRHNLSVRTWIEVDRDAIKKNYHTFRGLLSPETKLMAVVKSNAYGHELVGFSKEADKLGVDFFGVDSITEGVALRRERIEKPILVLGYTMPENFKAASENKISITVSSFDGLSALKENKYPLKIHIKIDSGMHRQGFYPIDAQKVIDALKKLPHVAVEGVFTHFANAKDPSFPNDTDKQAAEFQKATDVFEKAGLRFVKHASATAGAILFPQYHFDMVRIGIGLYGLWPAKEVQETFGKKIKLHPALSWKTVIAETKIVPKGDGIGYNFTEIFKKDTKIAVCPIGYWHGFPRALSSVGYVLVNGKRARVLGRVSMDMITVEVNDIKNIKAGDEVVLIGKSNKAQITADEFAEYADTSCYEIVTRINPKIQRVFV
jgi:alanine racemase